MPTTRVTMCLLLVSMLSACGGGSKLPVEPTPPSVSGRWQGVIVSPADGAGTITLDLMQTGLDVSGSLRLSQDGIADVGGTLTGTLASDASATSMRYTVAYTYGEGCQGTFSGTLNVTSRDMVGQYAGRNCVHDFTGTLRASFVR